MKLKLIAASITLALCPLSFADTEASLAQLQSQINVLQAQVAHIGDPLSSMNIGVDMAAPLGTLSKVQMPLQLVANRSSNPAAVILGGQLEVDLQDWGGSNIATHQKVSYGNNGSGTSLALTKLYLFTEANWGEHSLGLISFKNSLPTNSIAVDRAFLVLGQLHDPTPVFLTLGYTYLPFGSFSGNGPLNNTLTTTTFRVSPTNQASANAVLGPVTLIASAFNNQSTVNSSINGLFSVYFHEKTQAMHYNFGASYLSNMVGTNSGLGSAFSSTPSSQQLYSGTNPAIDVNFNLGVKQISLLGEYAAVTRAVMTNNGNIDNPNSWMLGLTGQTALFTSPYTWQVSYSKTTNMQNVPMPLAGDYQNALKTNMGFKSQWIGSIQGEYWQNTYIGPELTYGYLYNNAHTYSATLDLTAYF